MKVVIRQIVTVTFFILLVNSSSAQDDEIETDRPGKTDSPIPVNKFQLQVEQGFNIERDDEISTLESTTLLRYGLLKHLELRLEGNLNYDITSKGSSSAMQLQPIEVGTKLPLWQQKNWLPQTALLAHLGLPFLAARTFKGLKAMPDIKLTFQNELCKTLTLGYNAGAEWDGETADPEYAYSISNGIDFSEKWFGFLEVYGSVKKNESPQHSLDAGISFLINKNLKADAGYGIGISRSAPEWEISVGASYRFNKGKK